MRRFLPVALMLVFGFLIFPGIGSAQETDYLRPVTQAEFALGIVQSILGQVREGVDPSEALSVLQNRQLIPGTWDGEGNVTMGEASATFHRLGYQLHVEDSEALLTSGVFEEILRYHIGEFKRTKEHWDIVHHFSMGLELGQYRERILGPSADNPNGAPVSPSGF